MILLASTRALRYFDARAAPTRVSDISALLGWVTHAYLKPSLRARPEWVARTKPSPATSDMSGTSVPSEETPDGSVVELPSSKIPASIGHNVQERTTPVTPVTLGHTTPGIGRVMADIGIGWHGYGTAGSHQVSTYD